MNSLKWVLCALLSLALTTVRAASGREGQDLFKAGDAGVHTYRIPAIIQTQGGVLLAFAEARQNGGGDSGDIDLVVRRSTDGGKTWGETITVWDDGENVCGNPCPVVDRRTGRVILLSTWNNGKDPEKAIHARTSLDTRRVFVLYSDDEGLSWSAPREITSSVKKKSWTWYATGPCHAIQLSSGRIVAPCDHGNFVGGKAGESSSHVIYSDNGGRTWKIGGDPGVGNESTVTELPNGDVMLNMRGTRPKDRKSLGYARWVAISHDGGKSFDEPFLEKGLVEPVCNASIINYEVDGKLTDKLLFSNPSDTTRRRNMVLQMSNDSGKTWEKVCVLTEGPTAYSDLAVLPDGDVCILYECGDSRPYERIRFERIPASVVHPEGQCEVRLYPKGQGVDEGIVENGVPVTLGPGESNGVSGLETKDASGNLRQIGDEARMEFFFPEHPNGQMVISCPGGGYGTVCARKEGQDLAHWMNRLGITVCVVKYRLPYGHTTVPLTDVQNAFRYCRHHAKEWGIDQIGIIGFSAGGHLAASASTMFTDDVTRPDFSILIYPVIDLDHHKGTCRSLVGSDAALKEKYSLQHAVTGEVPPTLLALCADDRVVDPKSSLVYFQALLDCGVPAEMYIYPSGGHGWGFRNEELQARDALGPYRQDFLNHVQDFLQRMGK